MATRRPISVFARHTGAILCLLVLAVGGSCSTDALFNVPAARSNFTPGTGLPTPRTIRVAFINNTPYRAIFTYGAYDHLDEDGLPTNFGQLRLEGNTSSAQLNQPCRQTFSVGGDTLIYLLRNNQTNPSINITDPDALVDGVYFSSAPVGSPLAAQPTEGTALGRVVLSGVDFTCARTNINATTGTGLLIFTFVQDASAPGGFRIDYSFIAP